MMISISLYLCVSPWLTDNLRNFNRNALFLIDSLISEKSEVLIWETVDEFGGGAVLFSRLIVLSEVISG